ncbi:MAG TPA: DUF1697 domain-containing protein [Vicinamibacterales bacterium]
MKTHIALLRGINVGGHKLVAMSDLRALLTKLGFANAQTILQSGNLVFQSESRTGDELERVLEQEARKRLKLEADFIVRTAGEWKKIVEANPFQKEAQRDPGHLLVMFFKSAVDAKSVETLQSAITGSERMSAKGREAYIVYPDGVGRSRFTHSLIEKKLGVRGTGRNWNTVLKLGSSAHTAGAV